MDVFQFGRVSREEGILTVEPEWGRKMRGNLVGPWNEKLRSLSAEKEKKQMFRKKPGQAEKEKILVAFSFFVLVPP